MTVTAVRHFLRPPPPLPPGPNRPASPLHELGQPLRRFSSPRRCTSRPKMIDPAPRRYPHPLRTLAAPSTRERVLSRFDHVVGPGLPPHSRRKSDEIMIIAPPPCRSSPRPAAWPTDPGQASVEGPAQSRRLLLERVLAAAPTFDRMRIRAYCPPPRPNAPPCASSRQLKRHNVRAEALSASPAVPGAARRRAHRSTRPASVAVPAQCSSVPRLFAGDIATFPSFRIPLSSPFCHSI